jgi:hypothetical protein
VAVPADDLAVPEGVRTVILDTLALVANALDASLEDLVSPPHEVRGDVRRGRPPTRQAASFEVETVLDEAPRLADD